MNRKWIAIAVIVLVASISTAAVIRAQQPPGGPPGQPPQQPQGRFWSLSGNSGTNPTVDFLGTDDNEILKFKANGVEGLRINTDGRVAIGTPNFIGAVTIKGPLAIVSSDSPDFARTGTTLSDATRDLHIGEAMRFEPIQNAPALPSSGDLYFDDSEALCVYVDGDWAKIAGSGICR